MVEYIGKIVLFLLIVVTAQIFLSLDYRFTPSEETEADPDEKMPLISIPDAGIYTPTEEVLAAQRFQASYPEIGFLWKPYLGSRDTAILQWSDQDPVELFTDRYGFINSPEAIELQQAGNRIEILGLGGSFMQGAATVFHDFFSIYDRLYYNMATHRHTFPMFSAAFDRYADTVRPSLVLLGLNEASPALIEDYENWAESGLDWFTYHSGTWAGPPIDSRPNLGPLNMWETGYALAVAVLRKIGLHKRTPPKEEDQITKTVREIRRVADKCETIGAHLLVLYIPGKATALTGDSKGLPVIEEILNRLKSLGIDHLDLRPTFENVDDPSSLYYVVDGHWNKYGMVEAAKAIERWIDSNGTW